MVITVTVVAATDFYDAGYQLVHCHWLLTSTLETLSLTYLLT